MREFYDPGHSSTHLAGDVQAILALAHSIGSDAGLAISAFEAELAAFYHMPSAVVVASDCASFSVVLGALEIGPGDEVILSPLAPIWMLLPLLEAGVTPVFSDIGDEDFSLSQDTLAKAFSPRTRAVVAAPLWGYPADLAAISNQAHRKGVPLVVEISASLGATIAAENLAAFGDVACLSLRDGQPLSTGEGGVALFQDRDLARRAKRYSQFGDLDGVHLGANHKLSPLQATLGSRRLARLPMTLAEQQAKGAKLFAELKGRGFDLVEPVAKGRLGLSHVVARRTGPIALDCTEPFPTLLNRLPTASSAFTPCAVAETLAERIIPIALKTWLDGPDAETRR